MAFWIYPFGSIYTLRLRYTTRILKSIQSVHVFTSSRTFMKIGFLQFSGKDCYSTFCEWARMHKRAELLMMKSLYIGSFRFSFLSPILQLKSTCDVFQIRYKI